MNGVQKVRLIVAFQKHWQTNRAPKSSSLWIPWQGRISILQTISTPQKWLSRNFYASGNLTTFCKEIQSGWYYQHSWYSWSNNLHCWITCQIVLSTGQNIVIWLLWIYFSLSNIPFRHSDLHNLVWGFLTSETHLWHREMPLRSRLCIVATPFSPLPSIVQLFQETKLGSDFDYKSLLPHAMSTMSKSFLLWARKKTTTSRRNGLCSWSSRLTIEESTALSKKGKQYPIFNPWLQGEFEPVFQ